MFIVGYNCSTAAGFGTINLMRALYDGNNLSVAGESGGRVCFLLGRSASSGSYAETMAGQLNDLWKSVFSGLPQELRKKIAGSNIGLVFASTKGCVEDYIWNTEPGELTRLDPFTPITDKFLEMNRDFKWTLNCTISNACSSTTVSLEYIQEVFKSERCDYVLLAASDLIGPFIYRGFDSLKVLSHTQNSPFGKERDGLQLGDAISLLLLSKSGEFCRLEIPTVSSETEGALIARPSRDGESLLRALQKNSNKVDAVIAHGTGTIFNDLTEDTAIGNFLSDRTIPVTATKWCVGHTLGASGAVDLIAACEVLKNQKLFRICTTTQIDEKLNMNYYLPSKKENNRSLNRILLTSLGFGGVHAALVVQKVAE